jgi:hypothetical protein
VVSDQWVVNPKGDEHAKGLIAGTLVRFQAALFEALAKGEQEPVFLVEHVDGTLSAVGQTFEISVGPRREERHPIIEGPGT